jgi:hypothetical protein
MELPEKHSLNPFILHIELSSKDRDTIKAYSQEFEECARVLLRVKIDEALRNSSKELDEWVRR